jgi:hypothetical protein
MAKLQKRRRNGKVIKVGKVKHSILTSEAKQLIADGRGKEVIDSYGKVKKKYKLTITVRFK